MDLKKRILKAAELMSQEDLCRRAGSTRNEINSYFYSGASSESARLLPLIEALASLAERCEDAITEIFEQKCMWPGEVDDLKDSLANLERVVGGDK